MSGLIDALIQAYLAIHNTYIQLPSGGSVRLSVLCFGLPVLVALAGLLVPWGDVDIDE